MREHDKKGIFELNDILLYNLFFNDFIGLLRIKHELKITSHV